MLIKIENWIAFLLDKEEEIIEIKKRSQEYWIKIKNSDEEAFIIDKDKNKVRPFIKDYINRLPWSLEIKYLIFILWMIVFNMLLVLFGTYSNSYDEEFLKIEKQIGSIITTKDKSNMPKPIINTSLSWSVFNTWK